MNRACARPRDIPRAISAIQYMATINEDAAAEMTYSLPQGNQKVEGPSIRFAEALFQVWGNCEAETQLVSIDRSLKCVVVKGIFTDLETNATTRSEVRRRISDRYGKIYSDDGINKTVNAALAIARRNAILGGIPKPVWAQAYGSARKTIAGLLTDLPKKRREALQAFQKLQVTPDMLFHVLEIRSEEDITAEHLVTLRGMHSALKNGEATLDEIFSEPSQGAAPLIEAPGKPRTLADLDTQRTNPPAQVPVAEAEPEGGPTDPSGSDSSPEIQAEHDGYLAGQAGHGERALPQAYRGTALAAHWKKGLARARNEQQGIE